jgi:hypothetical protein
MDLTCADVERHVPERLDAREGLRHASGVEDDGPRTTGRWCLDDGG